jgi:hypothetical protein
MRLIMFSRRRFLTSIGASLLVPVSARSDEKSESPGKEILGRWDLVVKGSEVEYPSWLEVRRSGHSTLVGSFVGRFGSARPIGKIEWADGRMRFPVPPQWEGKDDMVVEGKIGDEKLKGELTDEMGHRLTWTGRRAPALKRTRPPKWDKPVELFNGKDLTGWKPQFADMKNGWIAQDGLLVNAKPGNNLLTKRTFDDFQLHAEFRYPKGSNSGIHLRGRYEVQIEDDYGLEPDSHYIGGVYGFLTPSVNSAKKAGEWQTMDITLVGRMVTVLLNDERIIDRQTIPGITGGALDSREELPGPLMLQGDHGPIEFRKVTITPGS